MVSRDVQRSAVALLPSVPCEQCAVLCRAGRTWVSARDSYVSLIVLADQYKVGGGDGGIVDSHLAPLESWSLRLTFLRHFLFPTPSLTSSSRLCQAGPSGETASRVLSAHVPAASASPGCPLDC